MKVTDAKSRKIDKKLERLREFHKVAGYSINIEKIEENCKKG